MTTTTKGNVTEATKREVIINDFSRFKEMVLMTSAACATKDTVPVLTGIKVEVKDGKMVMIGGDGVRTIVKGANQIIEVDNLQFCVPGKLLANIVKKLPEGTVKLSFNDGQIEIRSGMSKFKLGTLEAELYPSLESSGEPLTSFKISAEKLRAALVATSYACSTNEATPILQGVKISGTEEGLTFTGTDRFRLSRFNIPDVEVNPFFVVIDKISCENISDILRNVTSDCTVYVRHSTLSVILPGVVFSSRILEGSFPDTSKIIPGSAEIEVVVEKESMLRACDRVSLVVSDKNKGVLLRAKEEALLISNLNNDKGKAQEELNCSITGDDMLVAMDLVFLQEALKAIPTSHVRICFNERNKPLILKPEGEEAPDTLALVIPIRYLAEE